ncbi:ArsA family ATPase [Kitasatospora paracochleata]|uniref:Arsenite-transporting ATPase n=1 Tax=Kitasatospora paracochleata TaxID=58354 RepID=A0ABT1J122_9ACTN|nr:ArsA-related P-loop ATPase [Kitasatospora paracochleata]MCP2310786.1 arsenite-transporting ATPase [Kitasatospora paracochleata]
MTRTILVSGEASATVAAATALHHAGQGRRTLLLAADDPHRAVDALLETRLTAAPAPCAEHLRAARIDEQAAFRDALAGYRDRLAPALDLIGAEPLDPEELTPLPGTRPLALLRALREADAEVLVVAAPPPGDLLAALALPEQLGRYLARLLPEQRQAARALRPLLAAVAGVPMPADWLYEARTAATAALTASRAAVEAPGTTVRLVVDAETHRPDELRRIRAGLALYGHRLDAVVAHQALPPAAADSPDPWLAGLAARQRDRLTALAGELAEVPLLTCTAPDLTLEGMAAELYAAGSPAVPPAPEAVVEDRLAEDGLLVWRLPLPGADRGELELVRRGDELVVGVGGYRRILPLPSALRRCTVSGAGLADGVLAVRFAPDPDLWPRALR